MFEKFLSENAGDFRQRYEGTYGWYKAEGGKRMLCRLEAIGGTVCEFVDVNGVKYQLNADSDKDIGFEFLPPKSGFFNTKEGAILVTRIAARQFQRGVSHRNIAANILYGNDGFVPQKVDFRLLTSIFDHPVDVKDAERAFIKKGSESFAVSDKLAISGTRVYVLNEVIGTVLSKEAGKYVLSLHQHDLWHTELVDAFKASNLTVEFKQ